MNPFVSCFPHLQVRAGKPVGHNFFLANLVGIVDNCSSAAPKAADMAISLLSVLVARRCLAGCLLVWTFQGSLVLLAGWLGGLVQGYAGGWSDGSYWWQGEGEKGPAQVKAFMKGKYCKALNPLTLAHPICYRPAQALGALDPEPLAGALYKYVHMRDPAPLHC